MSEGFVVKILALFKSAYEEVEDADGETLEIIRNGLVSLITLIDEDLHIQNKIEEEERGSY